MSLNLMGKVEVNLNERGIYKMIKNIGFSILEI